MKKHKCPSCGAALKRGTYYCEYCGTDWTPDEPQKQNAVPSTLPRSATIAVPSPKNGGGPVPTIVFIALLFCCQPGALVYLWAGTGWAKRTKKIWTIILLVPLAAMIVYGVLYETVYTVASETPRYANDAPALAGRLTSTLTPETVYLAMRDNGEETLDARKKYWHEELEGQWVQWSGNVFSHGIYKTEANWLKVRMENPKLVEVYFYFDPLKNEELEKIEIGDAVTVSGRLWGYSFLGNTVRVADGEVVEVIPAPKTPEPEKEEVKPAE